MRQKKPNNCLFARLLSGTVVLLSCPAQTCILSAWMYVCGCRGTPGHTWRDTQRASTPEQWAQTSESHPSDSARVHGANQAPGTCSQATALVVDTAGFSTQKDKEG